MDVSKAVFVVLCIWPIVAFVVGVVIGHSIRLRDRIGR